MGTPLRACIVLVFLLLSPPGVRAQSGAGSAELRGQVSAAVAVAIPEARTESGGAQVSIASVNTDTIAVSISGSGGEEARVSLPILLRTNVGYGLRASFLSPDALSIRLSVAGVRATGKFVRADALEALRLEEALAAPRGERAPLQTARNKPLPVALLSGPPVSKAGTLSSPDNAIEVVLVVEVRPRAAGESWSAELTLSAAPSR